MSEIVYTVPDMSCGHCTQAVSAAVGEVAGVTSVAVDLGSKRVVVQGDPLDDGALRAAIDAAGYRAA